MCPGSLRLDWANPRTRDGKGYHMTDNEQMKDVAVEATETVVAAAEAAVDEHATWGAEGAEAVDDSPESAEYVGLTEEQVRREDEFMAGIPRFNIAAFLMPPIWGPAHGSWVTIVFYPLWIFVDNCLYATYTQPSVGTIIMAIVVVVSLAIATYMYAMVAGPLAAHRAAEMGVSKETYIKRQKIWAWVCAGIAILFLAFATYYNLAIRGAAA